MIEYVIVLFVGFVVMMFLTQLVFFEMARKKMVEANNLNWFLALDKPFHYNRTGYMIFVCLICYLISSPEELFTINWFIYFIVFLALDVIADMIVQYLILFYSKKRCQKSISDARLLKNELIEISQTMTEDITYQERIAQNNEKDVLNKYVDPSSHLAFLTVDGGEYVKDYNRFTEATFVVEPYGDIEKAKLKLADLPVKVTKLTPAGQMPFKDQKIDVMVCMNSNYDKHEIARVLKHGGYFLVNQNGTANYKEFLQMYMPFGMKGSWDAYSCAQTLEEIGMRIIDKFEDYGTIRFGSIQAIHSYFKKVSPDLADMNKYQTFYLNALKAIKENSFYEITTHKFLVVAQKG